MKPPLRSRPTQPRVPIPLPALILGFALLLAPHALAEDRALLIGAGKFACGKWELPLVQGNLQIMEAALTAEVGVRQEALRKIQDECVTRTGVLRVLSDLAREASPGDRLFLYMTGHGTRAEVGAATVRAYFTWDTIASAHRAGFEPETLITDVDLQRWTRPLREKGVFIVFIREACFSGGGYDRDVAALAPGRPPGRELVGHVEISACGANEAAWARDGAEPPAAAFTSFLAEVLGGEADRITAAGLFEQARSRVASHRQGQTPALDAAAGVDPAAVVIVDRTVVDLVVEVRDEVTGEEIPGAAVSIELPGAPEPCRAATPAARLPGIPRHAFLFPFVEKEGYVPKSQKVEVPRRERVLTITVELAPEVAEVIGRLEIAGSGSRSGIRVAYESGAAPLRASHVDAEVRPASDGSFRLRVPPRGPCRLLVVNGAETLALVEVDAGRDLHPVRFYDPEKDQWAGEPYDIGSVEVPLREARPTMSEAERAFEECFRQAEEAEGRSELDEAVRCLRLAGEAAALVADPLRKRDLCGRADKALERVEASLLSVRYETLVSGGKERLARGELAEAAKLAGEALAINPEGVLARILLKDVESRKAAGPAGEAPAPAAAASAGIRAADGVPSVPGFTFLRAETFQGCGVSNEVKIFRHDSTGLEFVLVPGGPFYDYWSRENVVIEPFLICRTECTQEAWDRIGGRDSRNWRGKDFPIETVSWNACAEWCRKVGLRLPAMLEWEYAARGGSPLYLDYSFGDSEQDLPAHAWYGGNSGMRPHPVGLKRPNGFGLFDVHGNVNEWCQDVRGPGLASTRINRGGCYYNYSGCSFFNYRVALIDEWNYDLGFRPAADVP